MPDETKEEKQKRQEEFLANWMQQIYNAKQKDASKPLSQIQSGSPVYTGPALGSPQSAPSVGYP